MICYGKNIKAKLKQRSEEIMQSFQECSPSGVTQEAVKSPATSCDNTCKMLSTKELIRNAVPRIFIGGWSHRHPLPSMCQNSRLPEGKQVFSKSHIVCTNCLGRVSRSYQFWEWQKPSRNPSFQTPVKGHLASRHFQGQQSAACCVNSFLHTHVHS